MENKKAQINLIDLIAGLIMIAGGVFVIFNYINFGTFLYSRTLKIEQVCALNTKKIFMISDFRGVQKCEYR